MNNEINDIRFKGVYNDYNALLKRSYALEDRIADLERQVGGSVRSYRNESAKPAGHTGRLSNGDCAGYCSDCGSMHNDNDVCDNPRCDEIRMKDTGAWKIAHPNG